MTDDKDKPQRRVYHLPTELVDRILAFQAEMGLPSEAEAARRLLDEGLRHRDNFETITTRLIARAKEVRSLRDAARDVLTSHPLVVSIKFVDEGVSFVLQNGFSVEVDRRYRGTVYDDRNNTYDFGDRVVPAWASESHPRPRNRAGTAVAAKRYDDLDDDIPF